MKSGKCPKCGSTEIYRSSMKTRFGFTGFSILIKQGHLRVKRAHIVYYACGQCNYLETYVDNEHSMQQIREEWISMNPRKSKRKNDES